MNAPVVLRDAHVPRVSRSGCAVGAIEGSVGVARILLMLRLDKRRRMTRTGE
jgi:hypothetical protein